MCKCIAPFRVLILAFRGRMWYRGELGKGHLPASIPFRVVYDEACCEENDIAHRRGE